MPIKSHQRLRRFWKVKLCRDDIIMYGSMIIIIGSGVVAIILMIVDILRR
jgi:hypothetical protein